MSVTCAADEPARRASLVAFLRRPPEDERVSGLFSLYSNFDVRKTLLAVCFSSRIGYTPFRLPQTGVSVVTARPAWST
jgi:hypothetical protein